jgi:peroxiredoxin
MCFIRGSRHALLFAALLGVVIFASCRDSGTASKPRSVPADEAGETPTASVSTQPPARPAPADTGGTSIRDAEFTVPDGPPGVILAFIERLANPAPFNSQEEVVVYQTKAARAINQAADKILSGQPTDDEAVAAMQWKLEALRIKGELGDASAAATAESFLDRMTSDPRPSIRSGAARARLRRNIENWESQTTEERLATVNRYIADVKANGLTLPDVGLLRELAVLSTSALFPTSDAAAAPFREVVPLFRAHSDPRVVEMADYMEATVRRLELPGKQIDLEGTFIDGAPFDWSSYRGKVVLVDFWATDCSECLIEIPNMLRSYRMYHDKGFEIVGVNMDNDRAQAKRLIEETSMEWPSLFDDDTSGAQWDHPIADMYGIDAIPRAILVDKDGTVVHMNARGPILSEELRKMLGEPAAAVHDVGTFQVPDGTPAEIIDAIQDLLKVQTIARTGPDQARNAEKLRAILHDAADKILAGEPTPGQAAEAIQMKIGALRGTPSGDRDLEEFIARLEASPNHSVIGAAAQIRLLEAVINWNGLSPSDREAAVNKYVAAVKRSGPAEDQFITLLRLAGRITSADERQLVTSAVSELTALYRESEDPEAAKLVKQLEGLARRINLIGSELELEGELLGGGMLDWDSYRGKVVLVDFCAGWHPPCRQEVANILRNYEKFREKGFDVVTISMDENAESAKSFVDSAGIKWATLFSSDAKAVGGDHPMAVRYAVTEIPFSILVDKEGKVITTSARGMMLDRQLEQQLGAAPATVSSTQGSVPQTPPSGDLDKAGGGI